MPSTFFRAVALVFALFFAPLSFAADPVNINEASAELIAETLKGVGPAKAAAIVQYRETHGPFVSVDQLTDVKGIGPALVDKNRDLIIVNTDKQ